VAGPTDETVGMRTWKLPLLTVVAALCVPATASAAFEHVVAPGESLYSVAVADGLSVDQLASANGISADTELTAGATLAIPPQTG
jgi:LysM repeat protein